MFSLCSSTHTHYCCAHLAPLRLPHEQAVVRQVCEHAHVPRLQLVGGQQVPQAVGQALGGLQGCLETFMIT